MTGNAINTLKILSSTIGVLKKKKMPANVKVFHINSYGLVDSDDNKEAKIHQDRES